MKFSKHLPVFLILIVQLVSSGTAGQGVIPQTTRQETPQAQPDSVAPQPFPAVGITESFGATSTLIFEALNKHLSKETIDGYKKELDTLISGINGFLGDTTVLSLKSVNRRELDQTTLRAEYYINQLKPLQDRLATVARGLESELTGLEKNRQRWQLTLGQGTEDEAVVSRSDRIQATIVRIDSARNLLQNDLVLILDQQDKLTDKKISLEELITMVKDQKVVLGETILTRDMPGFFRDLASLSNSKLFSKHVEEFRRSVSDDLALLKSGYVKSVIISLVLLGLLLAFLVWFKKNHRQVISETYHDLSEAHRILINSPAVTGLFIAALMLRLMIPDLPQTFFDLNTMVMMIPMAILMIRIYGKKFGTWIIVLVVAASLKFLYELSYHPGVLLRILLLGICSAGIWLFMWIYRREPFEGLIKHRFLNRFFRILAVVFLVLQFLAIIANLVGAFRLAEFFTLLPLQITILAIAIQILTKVADTLIFLLLASNYLQKLNVIREEFQVVYRKSLWLTDFVLLLLFLSNALRILRIRDAVFKWCNGILTNGVKLGEITISLGNILIFFFVIWLSIMITRMISHVLEKDVFSRVKTGKGIPGTIILLLRIALITVGVILAARMAGMELTNLSIVLGAFSVGIGFGLQNIFNNMVSGLILAFERPIKVGDVVQVGELMGTVRSIGLRSSTVKSFDGAEVIVPNGNLISNEMINWTLSDSYRRMDIRIGVAYGTNPELVLSILEEIATNHQDVRKDPPPRAYFIEFGDSSLNFRLLAWVMLDNRLEVESQLYVLIAKKLKEAGIEIPFPQRDLHIRSDDTKS